MMDSDNIDAGTSSASHGEADATLPVGTDEVSPLVLLKKDLVPDGRRLDWYGYPYGLAVTGPVNGFTGYNRYDLEPGWAVEQPPFEYNKVAPNAASDMSEEEIDRRKKAGFRNPEPFVSYQNIAGSRSDMNGRLFHK